MHGLLSTILEVTEHHICLLDEMLTGMSKFKGRVCLYLSTGGIPMFYNHHKPVFDFSFFSSLQIIREKYNTELLVLRKYSQNLIEEINALV